MEGPTSFVTLTHCCQEPKNTFINGKTGMAPQRNILTSPEEPAGRFRAYPQEAWVSYLRGSPRWGAGGSAECRSRRGACPISAGGSQAWLPGLDCAEVAFCNVVQSTPHSRYGSPRPSGFVPGDCPHPGVLPRAPFPLIANEGSELAPDISPGTQVPTGACWVRQVPACFSGSP